MSSDPAFSGYRDWLIGLKDKLRRVQIKAAVAINQEILLFYWELGADIVEKQKSASWGDRFLPLLSRDLFEEFPDMKGFSVSNLKYMRQWFFFYSNGSSIGQQAVGQIAQSTIGLLLCKNKDKLVAEYALSDIHKPMGVSEYQLTHSLPANLKSSLPTIEEIETGLGGDLG